MHLALTLIALVAMIGAPARKSQPSAAEATEGLSSMDPLARKDAAVALESRYAKDPTSLGDHGEKYWQEQLARLPGAPAAEASVAWNTPATTAITWPAADLAPAGRGADCTVVQW